MTEQETDTGLSGLTEFIVQHSEWDYAEVTLMAPTPLHAARFAVEQWSKSREVTYDGEDMDLRVRPTAGGQWHLFRATASVVITWGEPVMIGTEDDED